MNHSDRTMGKQKPKNVKPAGTSYPARKRNRLFKLFIVLFTFLLYGNTITNHYSLDDYHISPDNDLLSQGISAIPGIFTSSYAEEGGMLYGYRPVTRTSFAIENELFGEGTAMGDFLCEVTRNMGIYKGSSCNMSPYISHFINLLLYVFVLLVLFRVLRRLFRDYHAWFPFMVTLLFAAHPVHTEVVASLKNRDELFVLIFMLLSLEQFIRYADFNKAKHLVFGGFYILGAFLSKETTAAFFLIIPLSLFFFTEMPVRRVLVIAGIAALVSIIAAFGPFLVIPFNVRDLMLQETPLAVDDSLASRITLGFYTLLYYLRLLVWPHPLLYYYGYDMFPIPGFGNPWVIVSIILHLGLLAFAIYKLKDKHILSYAILVYLGSIAMFANIVKPAPGIVADRFLFIPSLGFVIALGYGIYRLFLVSPAQKEIKTAKLGLVFGMLALILIPYTAKTMVRNKDWANEFTLYKADMPYLYNSVKANDLYADAIMKAVNRELAKPVNVLKFVEPQVREAMNHWRRSVEIMPEYHYAWNSLGIIYSRIYKEYDTAIYHFNKALALEPKHPQTWFNLGQAYEGLGRIDTAIFLYKENLKHDTGSVSALSRMANLYYRKGEFKKAIELNHDITLIDPGEPLPYVNIGNYHFFQGDTTGAIPYYEKAVEMGAPSVASQFLSNYYMSKGDSQKANYYRIIAREQQQKEQYFVPERR